jgi:chorismate mutase
MAERRVLAIRGATTVESDDPALIRAATRELLSAIARRNTLAPGDVISAIFSCTTDLASEFPARAARELGWVDVPLLCTIEMPVVGAVERCIRVLLHVESARARDQVEHVYMSGARGLRPDLPGDHGTAAARDW